MAEALGIASGAAGLLSLAIEITKLSYSYVASVRGAPKALTSYLQELATLTSVLLQLDDFIQSRRINDQHVNTLIKALAECKREVELLKVKLEKKASWWGIKAKVAALAWPFTESELQDKVNMLHRYNGIFSSALQADSFTIVVANNKEIRELRQDVKTKEIIAWYQPDIEMECSVSYLEDYCPSTCSSSLESRVYLGWRSGLSSVLWAYGQPGAGKTTLAAVVLSDIRSNSQSDTAVVHHFFSSDRPKESLASVLRHLIAQALRQCQSIPQHAIDIFEGSSRDLITSQLVKVLESITEAVPTCIVFDGLDECQFLSELLSVLTTLQSSSVRVFATSRDLPKIRKHFNNGPSLEVAATNQDMFLYVNHRLKNGEVDFDLIGQKLISELVSAMSEKAAGSFLLARLTMDHITSLLTIKQIRKCLTSLPASFQEAYQSTFDRITKQSPGLKDLANRSLSLICHVKSPLKMIELQHALAVEEGMSEVDTEDLPSSKTIISACLGLVVLSKTDQTVEFVHSTARGFLQSTPTGMDEHPNLTIARTCIYYMSTDEMRRGPCTSFESIQQRFQHQPFLRYAAKFYGYHVKSIEKECMSDLSQFLEDDPIRESSWQILNFKHHLDDTIAQQVFESSPRDSCALHVAAFWGFSKYLATIMASDESGTSRISKDDLNKADSHGWTPLHWAVSMGHEEFAKALLEAGASPDLADIAGWTPVFWAAFKGYADIMEMLLHHNAAAFLRDTKGFTALHWATYTGHTKIVQRLLKVTMAPEELGRRTQVTCVPNLTDLTVSKARAIANESSKSLLELYAETTDTNSFSAIFRALKQDFRQEDIEPGMFRDQKMSYYASDPFLYGIFGRGLKSDYGRRSRPEDDYDYGEPDRNFYDFVDSLMIHAARSKNLPVIKLLLDLKIVNTYGINHLELLHDVAGSGWIECLSELISRGADVNQKDRRGQTALHRACFGQRTESINLLLGDRNIAVNCVDERGATPLVNVLTSRSGFPNEIRGLELVKLLLSKGASTSTNDSQGNTLMHYAMLTWNVEIFNLLRDLGLSMEAKSATGQLPLHWLACSKFFDNLKDITPDLTLSLRAKRKDFIKLVIDHSAPNHLDMVIDWKFGSETSKQTPFSLAVSHYNWDLAAEILDSTKRPLNATDLGKAQDIDHDNCPTIKLCNASPRLPSASKPRGLPRTLRTTSNTYYELQPLSLVSWTSLLEHFIETGVKINATGWGHVPPLHLCVQRAASVPVIEALLQAGADPYQLTKDGLDCFQLALLYYDVAGSTEILNCLRNYANVHPVPGHWLCQADASAVVDDEEALYLEILRDTNAINYETTSARTLIYEASSQGNAPLVEKLMGYGAYPFYVDDFGSTALHAAVEAHSSTTVGVLLQAGANVHQVSYNPYNTSQAKGTPLFICVGDLSQHNQEEEMVEIVRMLLHFGADPNDAFGNSDDRPKTVLSLPLAALRTSKSSEFYPAHPGRLLEVIKLLIDAGARVVDVADDITIGIIGMMEGYESLWEEMKLQLTRSDGSNGPH